MSSDTGSLFLKSMVEQGGVLSKRVGMCGSVSESRLSDPLTSHLTLPLLSLFLLPSTCLHVSVSAAGGAHVLRTVNSLTPRPPSNSAGKNISLCHPPQPHFELHNLPWISFFSFCAHIHKKNSHVWPACCLHHWRRDIIRLLSIYSVRSNLLRFSACVWGSFQNHFHCVLIPTTSKVDAPLCIYL